MEHRGRVFRDEGISGSQGRQKGPGLDALLKGVARREFDPMAAWSVCRLGRSLSDLIGLLGELGRPATSISICTSSRPLAPGSIEGVDLLFRGSGLLGSLVCCCAYPYIFG